MVVLMNAAAAIRRGAPAIARVAADARPSTGALLSAGFVAGLVAGLAACGEIRLVDPIVRDAPVHGAHFVIRAQEHGTAVHFGFQGRTYGYKRVDDVLRIFLLDAGNVWVGGDRARRRFVRAGEPEYVFGERVDRSPEAVTIRIGGSEVVPACSFEVEIPLAQAPSSMAALARASDLRIPVHVPASLSDSLVVRLSAVVEVRDAAGALHRLIPPIMAGDTGDTSDTSDTSDTGDAALVVPPDFLRRIPVGTAELRLSVQAEYTSGAGASGLPCAPALVADVEFVASRLVTLQ